MELVKPLTSKASVVLDLPPSCVQFCPSHPAYFVVGTYNLQKQDDDVTADAESTDIEKTQSRDGSLLLFKTDGEVLTHLQALPLPSAILDLRFHPADGREDILAVVSSTGTLAIFRIDPINHPDSPIIHLNTSRCDDLDEDVLFLQCNWHPVSAHTLGLTTSTGLARLVRLDDQWNIVESLDLDIKNSLEAWCIAFSPSGPEGSEGSECTAYCGGDDSMLRYNTYQPQRDKEMDGIEPCFETMFSSITIKGVHDAGVTAILPLSLEDEAGGRLVVTGSYDDHIRLLSIHDLPKTYGTKRARLMAEKNLGGGVWRLDLVSQTQPGAEDVRIIILASCMHAGSRIVELRREGEGEDHQWTWTVLARFEEHRSMNYGCSFIEARNEGLRCVSTSFYDKLLCLWEYSVSRPG